MPTYQRRQSSSALPIILIVGAVLLACGIGAAVYFASAGNDKRNEASSAKDSPPVAKAPTPPAPKPKSPAPKPSDKPADKPKADDREWVASVESEVAQARQRKRVTEPVKGRTMTMAEYQVALESVQAMKNRFPIDSTEPYSYSLALLAIQMPFRSAAVMPETARVVKREGMAMLARQSVQQLDSMANATPELRPLLDESFRNRMLARLPSSERKELHTKFATITGDSEPWSLLHPFDDLDGTEMKAAVAAAERVQATGLRSLNSEERQLLLRAGAADFVERSLR